MAEIESALIVGAGAVGAAVASLIQTALPGKVSVLADAERRERYGREGFILNGKRFDFSLLPAGVKPEPGKEPGLILIATKNGQLSLAIEEMKPYVGPETLILSLLNGITSEDHLAEAFGREKIPYAMIIGIDAVREGSKTSFSSPGFIHFGDRINKPGAYSERVGRIARFFDRAKVPYRVPEDMIRDLWYKLMINVGMNQAQAVLRQPYGIFQKSPAAARVVDAAMREVVALSAALGTGLVPEDIDSWLQRLANLDPEAKTSMLQDIEACRKTEVEAFAGTIVSLGKQAGVPTPCNTLLFDLIRALEDSYPA